jgi:hypothetical protein
MSTTLSFKKNRSKGILSAKFPPEWVDAAIAAYDAHPNQLKLTNGQTLKGLLIDRDDIRNLVNTPGFTDIYLRFIVEPTTNEITILAGAVVPGGLHGQCDKNNLYDYCEPCPNVCPTFI